MTIYRPRALAVLDVPVLGTKQQRLNQARSDDSIVLPLPPKSFRLESNDHNHADTLAITFDWMNSGIDPRLLGDAVVTLYFDNADDQGNWQFGTKNCRFIGLAREDSSKRDYGDPGEVTLDCLDYTTLFLEAKPFGSKGVPTYSQTLEEAWRTICSQTPGAEALADRLVTVGLEPTVKLGTAVAERFRKLSRVPVHPETDAWAVWQQCVGMLGLISFMVLDKCIVTTATDYYSASDPASFIWGKNLLTWNESRHPLLANRGIGITCFDPISGTTIEAVFPPIGDKRVKAKRAKAKKVRSQAAMRQDEQRDWFEVPGVTEQDAADKIAERVYQERSRQELAGHARTPHMATQTLSGSEIALPDLRAGDVVNIGANSEERQMLSSLGSDPERVQFLIDSGYTEEVASLIVSNAKGLADLESKFFLTRVATEVNFDDDGSFGVELEYVNRIQIDGSTGTQ